jgi:hypothetical protein
MKIIVSYSFTRDADNPGFCDVGMAFIVGLQRLGHEVYLIEEVTPDRCYDARHNPVGFAEWKGISHFEALAKGYGIWPHCCLIHTEPLATHGMSPRELLQVARQADLLVIISGKIETPILLDNVRCIAYVDINPAKTQVYHSEYGVDYGFENYHHFFTVGLNIGTPNCEIPTRGLNWRGIVQPVVLDRWASKFDDAAARFTTISTWAGRNTFYLNGRFSGEKSDQWLNFIELPQRTPQPLEIALKAGRGYAEQVSLFEKNGWHLTDARQLRNFDDYRDYIAGSRAEFSIGNNRYV